MLERLIQLREFCLGKICGPTFSRPSAESSHSVHARGVSAAASDATVFAAGHHRGARGRGHAAARERARKKTASSGGLSLGLFS